MAKEETTEVVQSSKAKNKTYSDSEKKAYAMGKSIGSSVKTVRNIMRDKAHLTSLNNGIVAGAKKTVRKPKKNPLPF